MKFKECMKIDVFLQWIILNKQELVDYLQKSHVLGAARKPYEMPVKADVGVHSSGLDPSNRF